MQLLFTWLNTTDQLLWYFFQFIWRQTHDKLSILIIWKLILYIEMLMVQPFLTNSPLTSNHFEMVLLLGHWIFLLYWATGWLSQLIFTTLTWGVKCETKVFSPSIAILKLTLIDSDGRTSRTNLRALKRPRIISKFCPHKLHTCLRDHFYLPRF